MTHHRYKNKYRVRTVHTVSPVETSEVKKTFREIMMDIPLEDSPTLLLPIDCAVAVNRIETSSKPDQGKHYRFSTTFPVAERDFKAGRLTVQLDPFKIAEVYNMTDFALMTILKKTLCAGNRGHKNLETALRDIICAAERRLEMIEETKLTGDLS